MKGHQEFLSWLDEQNSYSVRADVVEEKFPDLPFNFVGVTMTRDEDGNTLVPKRDYRQAIIYRQPLD
jgi:hypothetical protein